MLRLSAGPLLCVAHREGPFKGPARSAHGVEPALRGPAEFVPGAVGTGIANRDIARAARRDAISDRDVVNALERRDHVEHRITLACAEVPDAQRRVARDAPLQRPHLAPGQVADMATVPTPGALARVVIAAEHHQSERTH